MVSDAKSRTSVSPRAASPVRTMSLQERPVSVFRRLVFMLLSTSCLRTTALIGSSKRSPDRAAGHAHVGDTTRRRRRKILLAPSSRHTVTGFDGDWGNFLYKKREISIQDIIIYHHISCRYHDISLCIISSIMIYHVPRRIMIYRDIIFFFSPCDIMSISCRVLDDTWT